MDLHPLDADRYRDGPKVDPGLFAWFGLETERRLGFCLQEPALAFDCALYSPQAHLHAFLPLELLPYRFGIAPMPAILFA